MPIGIIYEAPFDYQIGGSRTRPQLAAADAVVTYPQTKKKHIGNNQRKRRKLIRQNPPLLRSKKYR